ncbi:MAG TPA: 3-oxoacyl-ACP reductase FabG [Candidatus Megaira endosymbiont of Nemacystus decipiens]|nr:3-oxoacyl-ACP reductase FabG [Candidatus Megaera endosymbiont of Nemacystus decipiens]
MIDLKGNTVFITGASGGIGKAITKQLHSLGAHVYISGSNFSKLQKLGDELEDNYTIKQCDLSVPDNYEKILDDIEKLDILICNAGVTKDGLAMRMSSEDFDKVIDVNLKANFVLNKMAIKKMMKARYGRIINISSVVALSGNPGQANYCASKAGLIGMSKSLALEVASRNITVNCIAPGFIKSSMTDALNESQVEHIKSRIPLSKIGLPEDIAYMSAYLASRLSSYITGQTIHINGGMLMQ